MVIFGYEYINKLLKPFLKLGKARLPYKQTLTLKLGVTLILTVTQVYVFITLRQLSDGHANLKESVQL